MSEICDAVVIIEQGRVVAAGNVDDMQQKLRERRVVELRLLDRQDEAERFLLEQPLVVDVAPAGDWFRVEVEMDEAQQTELLASIVGAGFKVAEFRVASEGLEQLFMALTKGKVQ